MNNITKEEILKFAKSLCFEINDELLENISSNWHLFIQDVEKINNYELSTNIANDFLIENNSSFLREDEVIENKNNNLANFEKVENNFVILKK
jgi:Asp-tRNA(Asn)/Glu-tRNA(Gln) amidotransferase C subunit